MNVNDLQPQGQEVEQIPFFSELNRTHLVVEFSLSFALFVTVVYLFYLVFMCHAVIY